MSSEVLHTCTACGRSNFTTRGLRAHVCRPDRSPSPMPKSSLSPAKAPAVIDLEPAAPALAVAAPDPWAKARRFVEAATLFQRASLAAQIMAGLELLALHKIWGVQRGGDRRSKPHDVALIQPWSVAVKKQLGISDQTAGRWMEMARAARPRLSKGDLDLGALLEKHPGALTPAEQELLKKAVHKISDGRTQMEFLLECGVTKAAQGSGSGKQKATTTETTATNEDNPEPATPAASPLPAGWEEQTHGLHKILTSALEHAWWKECDLPALQSVHGNLLDLSAQIAEAIKGRARK